MDFDAGMTQLRSISFTFIAQGVALRSVKKGWGQARKARRTQR
jgi:hypothetical protein